MSSSSSNSHNSNFQTPPPSNLYNGPPLFIAFFLIILIVFFFGFCVLYFCKCVFVNIIQTWAFQRTASGNLVRISTTPSPNRGLDPSQLEHFPTFSYATVKNLRKQNCSLECAICLLEFEEDSFLRLLTVCYHVFHQECIDLWLCSHKSCPVCRTELDSPANETKLQDLGGSEVNQNGEERRESLTDNDDIRIDVKDDGDDERGGGTGTEKFEEQVAIREQFGEQEEECQMKFARSHSTGHSVVLTRGGDEEVGGKLDKYTLKLPEHAEIKIMGGGHKCTKSCATSMEMTHCVFLEGYSSPSSETDQKIRY